MAPTPDRIDELITELRHRGERATVARRAVLEVLLSAGATHLTADELARRVRERHPAIHLSTIYRTLDSLTGAHMITLARVGDGRASYHLAEDRHHHASCTACGTTLSLPPDILDPVIRRLLRDHGFVADPHHLTIAGRCRDCTEAAIDR